MYIRRYIITENDELFCSTEYSSRITAGRHIHLFQTDDVINSLPFDWKRDKFNELILAFRPGKCRHVYINMDRSLKKLLNLVVSVKSEMHKVF